MTERELLENAAKAAGIAAEWRQWPSKSRGCMYVKNGQFSEAHGEGYDIWNPLSDDGDALRLAVRLRMHARQFPVLDNGMDAPLGMVEVWRVDDDDPVHVEFLRMGEDRLIVTRRAIVRAAAEIGRLT